MGDATNVLVQRRRLAAALTTARKNAGKTQAQAAAAMESSLSTVQRIEKGITRIKINDLRELMRFYGITDQWDQLLDIGRDARKPPWWGKYRKDAPKGLLTLIEHESVASAIKQFETTFVPGILQTEDYAGAVLEARYDEKTHPGRVKALVELRTKRRELLDVENPPRFHFVLDESVIHRVVGGRPIMREQLHQLIEATNKPNVTLEIVPFAAGAYSGMGISPFEIVEFTAEGAGEPVSGGNGEVLFEESSHSESFSNKPEDVLNRQELLERLERTSLGPQESVALLGEVADTMK